MNDTNRAPASVIEFPWSTRIHWHTGRSAMATDSHTERYRTLEEAIDAANKPMKGVVIKAEIYSRILDPNWGPVLVASRKRGQPLTWKKDRLEAAKAKIAEVRP